MILIDGEPGDSIPVTDSAVVRGDGCFEGIRVYESVPFAVGLHLDRLARSAKLLDLELPDRSLLESWVETVARADPDSAIRILLTRGGSVPGATEGGRCIVFSHPVGDHPSSLRLGTVSAPWHAAGRKWDLMGAKTLSYAPNMAASRTATASGFDDAILLSDDGIILELPTSSLAWVVDGVVETPELGLGILESITRGIVLSELRSHGYQVVEGRWTVDRLATAQECLVMSSVREIVPVTAVDSLRFQPGPLTERVVDWYSALTRSDHE
ncbi:MAG: hypothetical protein GEU79_16610 [Acidimicrobiia bacterium]|nr:hypothetical protein [Acidimicrobiia bacterium]